MTIDPVELNRLRFIVQWSSIALIWYDYVLTFGAEVKYIWRQRFRISTALYICCRYALLSNVLYLLIIFNEFGDTCDRWSKAITSLAILGRSAIIVTFTARTYIICDRSAYVLAYLSALGVAWTVVSLTAQARLIRALSLLLSTLMGTFEFSSALITLSRCMQTLRATKGMNMRAHRFFMLLLEQGVLYLIYAALFTITAIVLNYYAPPMTFCQRLLNVIALPLSCIFTARFLLHLRCLEERLQKGMLGIANVPEGQDTAESGTLRFHLSQMSSIMIDLGVDANVDDRIDNDVSTDSGSVTTV